MILNNAASVRNLRLIIEYDGTAYCGWQIQRKATISSVQELIEKSLKGILKEKVKLIASGRTDAGVHVLAQAANFKTCSRIPLQNLQRALNGSLPGDIVITKIEEVSFGFHSRFSARSKLYRYLILNRPYPSALLRNRAYCCAYPLDIKLMRSQARCLVGRHDFKAFCASGSSVKDTIRTIKKLSISRIACNLNDVFLIAIDIEADGFLYNMARNISGTLIEIGRGRFPKGYLRKILLSRDRKLAGPTAPAHGLYLVNVCYAKAAPRLARPSVKKYK